MLGKKRSRDDSDPHRYNPEPKGTPSLLEEQELHPLLRDMASLPKASNPLKRAARSRFDASLLNPYIDQKAFAKPVHRRPLQLNPKGKWTAQGDELRQQQAEAWAKEQAHAAKAAKGLVADENLQEQLLAPQPPPLAEWWDLPYIQSRLYREYVARGTPLCLDDEQQPVTLYIQHPVPIPAPWDRPADALQAKVYLTKKEAKRRRRNERMVRHKEAQDRIRLGLDPPPPPKVKLANLMNVLTNEAIRDPTGVEMKVRKDVEERHRKHMAENERRKPTQETKARQREEKLQRQLAQGLFTAVYRVETLADKQHFFKVDMNAKQLNLVGVAVLSPRFCVVVVEGPAKALRFFKKLMTHRIKWQELATGADVAHNQCRVVWEGELKEPLFQKWSPMYTQSDDEASLVLGRFGHENYWRLASAMPAN